MDPGLRGKPVPRRKQKVAKSAGPKEGDMELLRELTAGDWAWLRQRVERRRGMRVEGEEDEVVVEEEEEELYYPGPQRSRQRSPRRRGSRLVGVKRKWAEVLTLHEDQDGDNEGDEEEGSLLEEEGFEEDSEEEQEDKRRKLNWPVEEEEFLADPITNLNPILDRCHITNN